MAYGRLDGKEERRTLPQPTEKQRKAAENLGKGMDRTEALIAAGYTPLTAERCGAAILKSPGIRCAIYDQARQVARRPMLSAPEQESFVRAKLLEASIVEEGANKLRALELMGKDKRVAMWQPDVQIGVLVNLESPAEPDAIALPPEPED